MFNFEKYSFVLEYVDSGTLGKYLKDDTINFYSRKTIKIR